MKEVGNVYDLRKHTMSLEKEFHDNRKHILTLDGAIRCMEEIEKKLGEQTVRIECFEFPVSAMCKDVILFLEEMQDAQEQSK